MKTPLFNNLTEISMTKRKNKRRKVTLIKTKLTVTQKCSIKKITKEIQSMTRNLRELCRPSNYPKLTKKKVNLRNLSTICNQNYKFLRAMPTHSVNETETY
jgi:hypothetical protein